MKDLFSEVHWGRVLLTGLAVVILVIILNLALFFLASQIWSQPGQAQTVNQVSSWTTYILLLLLTVCGAIWVASKVEKETSVNGLLVGLVVGLILFILSRGFGSPFLTALVTLVLNMAAGYLGGALAGRGRRTSHVVPPQAK